MPSEWRQTHESIYCIAFSYEMLELTNLWEMGADGQGAWTNFL